MKPGTFSQLYIHLVFAVEFRQAMINKNAKNDVIRIVSNIINEIGHKTICVNSMPDHIHILLGLNPKMSVSETVHEIKFNSFRVIYHTYRHISPQNYLNSPTKPPLHQSISNHTPPIEHLNCARHNIKMSCRLQFRYSVYGLELVRTVFLCENM